MSPFKTTFVILALAALTMMPQEAAALKKLKLKKLLGLGLAAGALGHKKVVPLPIPIPLPFGIESAKHSSLGLDHHMMAEPALITEPLFTAHKIKLGHVGQLNGGMMAGAHIGLEHVGMPWSAMPVASHSMAVARHAMPVAHHAMHVAHPVPVPHPIPIAAPYVVPMPVAMPMAAQGNYKGSPLLDAGVQEIMVDDALAAAIMRQSAHGISGAIGGGISAGVSGGNRHYHSGSGY